jgi:hypothetical protein
MIWHEISDKAFQASTDDCTNLLVRLQMEFLQMEECRVSRLGGAGLSLGKLKSFVLNKIFELQEHAGRR